MFAIGLMSGTSLDGIDAALIDTDGSTYCSLLQTKYLPYTKSTQKQLKDLINAKYDNSHSWLELEYDITEHHINCIKQLMQDYGQSIKLDVIGFHGQSIYHNPKKQITWQIGNPHLIARALNTNVISDFRRRDIALNGCGAPLVPIFHSNLMINEEKPVAVLNIGGVSNITYIDNNNIIAFDTGPGNALINDAMLKHYNIEYDNSGIRASLGEVNFNIINHILKDEYFSYHYPKSLDRNYFYKYNDLFSQLRADDLIATLTYLTVKTILSSCQMLPKYPKKVFVCGGGVNNKTIMQELNNNSYNISFENIIVKNLDPDFIEAQCFGYIAARYINNMPSAIANVTGAIKDSIAGVLYQP